MISSSGTGLRADPEWKTRSGFRFLVRSCFMRLVTISLLLAIAPYLHARSGTVCVAPSPGETPQRCAPGLCGSGELSFKIDGRPVQSWPKIDSLKLDGLDASQRHRVVIYRAKKPQQSFVFRFSDFKSPKLCLFSNDLYWTAQLWEAQRAPWCKCQ
jgi:hypothetical protein